MYRQSESDVVLGLDCSTHDVPCDLVQLVMFIMQSLVLQLQVLELFILGVAICFENIS